jgi:hypothetical protein
MNQIVLALLRAALVGAFLCGVFAAAVVIPTTAADEVERFPPYAPYAAPYTAAAVVAVLCVLGALVAAWVLLSMIQRDAIFSRRSLVWVNVIIWCFTVATVLAGGVCVHLAVAGIPSPDDGMEILGAILTTGGCAALGGTFVLLLLVLRQLLLKATELRTEMAGVV